MNGGFELVPSELTANAADLQSVSEKVAGAQSAAQSALSLSPQAFGLLCSFFTPPCLAMSTAAIGAIGGLKDGVAKRGRTVVNVRTDFEETDAKVAEAFDSIRGNIR